MRALVLIPLLFAIGCVEDPAESEGEDAAPSTEDARTGTADATGEEEAAGDPEGDAGQSIEASQAAAGLSPG